MSLVYDIYTGKMVDTETHKPIEAEKAEKEIQARKEAEKIRKEEEYKQKVLADPLSYPVEDSIKYIEDPTERFVKSLNYLAWDLDEKPTFVDDCDCSIGYEIEWYENFKTMMKEMYATPEVNKDDPTIKKYRKLYDELKTAYDRINWKQVRFNDKMLAEAQAQTSYMRQQAQYAEQSYKDQQYEFRRQAEADRAYAEEQRRAAQEARRQADQERWEANEARRRAEHDAREAEEKARHDAEVDRLNKRHAAYTLALMNGKSVTEAQKYRDLF